MLQNLDLNWLADMDNLDGEDKFDDKDQIEDENDQNGVSRV